VRKGIRVAVPTCANCGNEEPGGTRFCGSCGTPFPTEESPTEQLPKVAELVTCASCGNEEPEGAQFCGACGAALAVEAREGAEDDRVATSEAAPPPVWTGAPTPEAEALPPPTEQVSRPRRRVDRRIWVPAVAVLVAGAAVAVLFGAGVLGGEARKSEVAFVNEVNDRVLRPLGLADETAAGNAESDDSGTRVADGQRIVRAADGGWAYLRGLSDLSAAQKGDVQILLAVVAANRGYGQALARFTPDDTTAAIALEGTAAAARAAIATARSRLSADLRLPSEGTIVTMPASEETTSTAGTTTVAPPTATASQYVQQVDSLLRESHGVVLAVRSFVRRAASDAIGRSAAVALARSHAEQRRAELERAGALVAPPGFARAHRLLVLSFQASLADDEALVAWALARQAGSGNARAAFDHANRLGARASGLKRRFLREYGLRRQIATGLSRRSLPSDF
jgi:Double zinc ribbon